MTLLIRLSTVVAIGAVVVCAGCARSDSAVTGLGATESVWRAHHDTTYSSVLFDPAGRVEVYVVTMSARPLAQAVALVTQDLPADAKASAPSLVEGIEGTMCEIVEFTSPTLSDVLGGEHGGDVMAVFAAESAVDMDTTAIARAVVVSGNEQWPRQC
jgi:hypothetical protein